MSSKRFSFGSHFLSRKKKTDLSDLFTSFDKDNDGKISHAELEDMLHSAGVESTMVQEGATGGLDYQEFAKLMRPTLSEPLRLTSKQSELKAAFDAFDKNNDGFIDVLELQAMMVKLNDKMTLEEVAKLIEDVDLDKDGLVSFHEFSIMMDVKQPGEGTKTKPECSDHQHHRSSLRRLFCSHK